MTRCPSQTFLNLMAFVAAAALKTASRNIRLTVMNRIITSSLLSSFSNSSAPWTVAVLNASSGVIPNLPNHLNHKCFAERSIVGVRCHCKRHAGPKIAPGLYVCANEALTRLVYQVQPMDGRKMAGSCFFHKIVAHDPNSENDL